MLLRQYRRGRVLTGRILDATAKPTSREARRDLVANMAAFVRMYEPQEAREDTVVFPAMRDVIVLKEFAEMGEIFEDEELRQFHRRTARVRDGSAGWDQSPVEVLPESFLQHDRVVSVLVCDADRGGATAHPMPIAIFVVGFASDTVVMWAVDFDDDRTAVADDHEVGATYARIPKLGGGERQDGDGLPWLAVTLDFSQGLVDDELGPAAEDQPVHGWVTR
ncbi:hypothetical protein [Nonomuraea sp. B19D2]|uniref:hypothetical protein n=1 Tax=Nonomuraea sp. B19D2 TaxID=3159561 RepID=UPI0032DB509F